MKFLSLTLALSLLLCFRATAADPQPSEPVVDGALELSMELDARKPIEPVNRRVLGLCLMFPPFSEKVIEAAKPILKDSSVRVWLHCWPKKEWMDNVMKLVKDCEVKEVLAMNPLCSMPNIVAKYKSEKENNLCMDQQRPAYQKTVLDFLNGKPHDNYPNGYGFTGYEIWNEPQFPQNGAWSAESYARYSLDVSRRLREADPKIDVGFCLRPSSEHNDWNRAALLRVAASDVRAIDFGIHHPYDFFWMRAEPKIGSYYARCAGLELHAPGLKEDVSLLQSISHGRWRLALTEWGTHPTRWDLPKTSESWDLAAAINLAGGLQLFWEAGADSAHYFVIHDFIKNGRRPNFALMASAPDGSLVFNPVYHALRLYAECAYGMRLESSCKGPSFKYPQKDRSFEVPLAKAMAIFDEEASELRVLAINRHASKPVELSATLNNFMPDEDFASLEILTGDAPLAEEPLVKKGVRAPLAKQLGGPLKLALEPHSVTAIRIKGHKPLTDDEKLSKSLRFIGDWQVCGVFDVGAEAAKPDHGLSAKLPCEGAAPDSQAKYEGLADSKACWSVLHANESGYVDAIAPHRILGLDKKIKEGVQAYALSYVWSPDEREIGVSVGADYWARLYVNGALAVDMISRGGQPAPDTKRGRAKLRKGWNVFALRLASGSLGVGFWVGVEDQGELAYGESPSAEPPKSLSLSPVAAAHVNGWKDFVGNNYSGLKDLQVSGNQATPAESYLKWDLKDPSFKGRELNAKLELKRSFSKGSGKVWLAPLASAWEQDSVCYAKKPLKGPGKLASSPSSEELWSFQSPELDALVKSWIDKPEANFGLCVGADWYDGYAGFSNVKPDAPRLTVNFKKAEPK